VVKYSPKSAKALGFLKKVANDVEIFVEDTSNPNMWVNIVRRLLPHNLKIRSVTPLGTKANVIAACKLDQADDGRKKLYIVDGDFDYLHGKRKPRLKHLYRLRAYCAENLLLSPSTLIAVGEECSPRLDEATVARIVQGGRIQREIESLIAPLFQLYAAINKAAPSVITVRYSVHKLLIRNSGITHVDPSKIISRYRDVLDEGASIVGRAPLLAIFRAVRRRATKADPMVYVSGKDYLLPLFARRLKEGLGFRGSIEQLKVRLAREFDPAMEPGLGRAIAKL
jgi:hypothetical protein